MYGTSLLALLSRVGTDYCSKYVGFVRFKFGCTRLGASSEQVVRDVNPDMGFRVFDKPTSES